MWKKYGYEPYLYITVFSMEYPLAAGKKATKSIFPVWTVINFAAGY